MNKILSLLLLLPFVFSCDKGSVQSSNPNIPNYSVNLQIDLNLPSYSNLQFAGNYIVNYSQGARGIVVFNAGSNYNAFDLACPNQAYQTCTSPMTVSGTDAKCTCDNTIYNLFSGQSPGQQYAMKAYRVEVNGTILTIYN